MRIKFRDSQLKVQKTSKFENTKASNWWDCDGQYDDNADCPESSKSSDDPKPASTLQIMSETDWEDMIAQKAIAVRTRLTDGAWTIDPGYKVYIDHDALFDILSAAESLAKRCLWGWTRTHRPVHCQYGLGYRSDIDFGRLRLESWMKGLPQGFFTYRYTQPWKVIDKLQALIYLRNFLHHFNGGKTIVCYMDRYVETVQELAVLLYDEEAASRARALRDRLRKEAERTLGEIEALMMLTSLPYAGAPWSPHHADLIQKIASECDVLARLYPPIVCAAAREWTSHHRTFNYGVTQPELDASTEAACGISHSPGLPTATASQQYSSIVRDNPTKPMGIRRRYSFSEDTGRMVIVAGGQAEGAIRRRAASMCHGM